MDVQSNKSLRELNTFGIEAGAHLYAEVHNENNLLEVLSDKKYSTERRMVLGGGSNILLTGNVNGLVLHNRLQGIEVVQEDNNHAFVRAMAGVVWHHLVLYCIEKNLGGIENLSLIPGFVGAAPIQNIGAYGAELKDVFSSLEAFDLATGEKQVFAAADCGFGYRLSVFKTIYKNRFIITSVTLKLSKKHVLNTSYGAIGQELERMGVQNPGIREVSDAVISIRTSKLPDPAKIGNAGSFFKNPEIPRQLFDDLKKEFPGIVSYPAGNLVKLAAGWLIEQCGWKGKRSGRVGMHEKQALVLVNYGGATGAELYEHALKVQQSVLEKFGVKLEMEVNIV